MATEVRTLALTPEQAKAIADLHAEVDRIAQKFSRPDPPIGDLPPFVQTMQMFINATGAPFTPLPPGTENNLVFKVVLNEVLVLRKQIKRAEDTAEALQVRVKALEDAP